MSKNKKREKVTNLSLSLKNKEIVREMLGGFENWLKATYGFSVDYDNLKLIAIQLFFQEYLSMMSAELQSDSEDVIKDTQDKPED